MPGPAQVICGAGTVCVFHMGGHEELYTAEDGSASSMQRWEFFVGDQPHAQLVDGQGMRPAPRACSDGIQPLAYSMETARWGAFGLRHKTWQGWMVLCPPQSAAAGGP